MRNSVDDIIVELIKDMKKAFFDFRGIYLFGLFLDGKMHQDEDMELVAIFDNEQDKSKREQIWRIIGKAEVDFDVFIDFYPMTKEELENDEEFFEDVVINGIFYKPEEVTA